MAMGLDLLIRNGTVVDVQVAWDPLGSCSCW
jgi:hypothetical protein